MTDGDSLLHAILSNPADDTPRLVYADWLDENGESDRAEFIRVQCRIARMEDSGEPCEIDPYEGHTCCKDPCPVCASVEKYAGLERRERELLRDHEWDWLHACCSELHRGSYAPETQTHHWLYPHVWRRGFLDELTLNADAWLEMADAVFWSPKQTVWCGECGATYGGWVVKHDCDRCAGTGRAPRPFVPTAHPITRVGLTTNPALLGYIQFARATGRPDEVYAHPMWPGVEFTLPGLTTPS